MESLLSYLIAISFVVLGIWLRVDDYRAAKRRQTFFEAAAGGYFIAGNDGGAFSVTGSVSGGDAGGDGGGSSC
jgi:hypothetical protein